MNDKALAVALCALLTACARVERPTPSHATTWGASMGDVGRRFELLGRAGAAGRLELARYALGEMEEVFEDDLAHAAAPREGDGAVLQPMRATFLRTSVPDVARALQGRDRAAFEAAFARAASACNDCHRASGHGFIEVPSAVGASVPRVDPLP